MALRKQDVYDLIERRIAVGIPVYGAPFPVFYGTLRTDKASYVDKEITRGYYYFDGPTGELMCLPIKEVDLEALSILIPSWYIEGVKGALADNNREVAYICSDLDTHNEATVRRLQSLYNDAIGLMNHGIEQDELYTTINPSEPEGFIYELGLNTYIPDQDGREMPENAIMTVLLKEWEYDSIDY